ncbi:MAG: signal recognition particle-docking protein FtsY [Candidatus Diapherotrites archaeon]|nr:signal recognition particle-docking protein FtsY [Candidatus Diapherotrites archaeon]
MFYALRRKLNAFAEKLASRAQQSVSEKRDISPELRAPTKIKAFFKKEIKLREADIKDSILELELALLEADVNEETARKFCKAIKQALLNRSIPTDNLKNFVRETIKQTLKELMQTESIDIIALARESEKPFKMLFLGPNGAGKTTTMAKLAHMLQKDGLTTIFAASDTFRAASIEQLEEHAKRLNIRVIKHKYGSDPAAVAFDAVNAAKASNADIVMIDTAGRQETNRNLIEELRKIARVVNPHIKIFVGEAFAGKNLVEQAKEFDNAIGIDAFIITKLDTDAKGGTVLSLLYELKKPILFVGTGQAYTDLMPFSLDEIIERIV